MRERARPSSAAAFAVAVTLAAPVALHAAAAPEFRAVGEQAAILYDAPSVKSKRRFIVSRGYPLEVLVTLEGWIKVRDAAGDISWIESRALGEQKTVLVKVPAAVRQAAEESSPILFQAQANLVLEALGAEGNGWLKVRHADGAVGYIRMQQVWGATGS